jgi:acyl carrier protein
MNVYETVAKIFVESFVVPAERITAEATLEELELDSIELVELSMIIEQEFGVKLSDEQLADSELNVGGLVEAINSVLGAGVQ